MGLFGKKGENRIIEAKRDCVMWDVDVTGFGENDTYTAASGCYVAKIVNGNYDPAKTVSGGDKPARLFERGENKANTRFVAICSTTEYSVRWGVGGLYFADKVQGVETSDFGLNGSVTFKVNRIKPIYDMFKGSSCVSIDDVWNMKVKDIMREIDRLYNLHSKSARKVAEIREIVEKISKDAKYALQKSLENDGIQLFDIVSVSVGHKAWSDCTLTKTSSTFGSSDYDSIIGKWDKKEEKSEDEKFLELCSRGIDDSKPAETEKKPKEAMPEETVVCPTCGLKNSSKNRFCNRCGTKLVK